MNAPQVIAKGESILAEKIREIAQRHNVPIIQNVPLAHSLITLEVDDEIPEELYEAVAEILSLASKLAQNYEN